MDLTKRCNYDIFISQSLLIFDICKKFLLSTQLKFPFPLVLSSINENEVSYFIFSKSKLYCCNWWHLNWINFIYYCCWGKSVLEIKYQITSLTMFLSPATVGRNIPFIWRIEPQLLLSINVHIKFILSRISLPATSCLPNTKSMLPAASLLLKRGLITTRRVYLPPFNRGRKTVLE